MINHRYSERGVKEFALVRDVKPALRELAARSERAVEFARGDHAIPALMKLYPKKTVGRAAADLSPLWSSRDAAEIANDAKFALHGMVHPRYGKPGDGSTGNPWKWKFREGLDTKQGIRDGVAARLKGARSDQQALNAASAERKASKDWRKMNPGALSGDW